MKSKTLIFIGLICSLILTTSCDDNNFPCINASGPVVESDRNVAGFDEVYNSISAVIHIEQGENWTVKVMAQENIIDKIQTSLKGDELHIESDYCLNNSNIEVFIVLPELEKVGNAGSGFVIGDNPWTGNNLQLDLSGSGAIDADVSYQTIEIGIAGSGDIELVGECNTQLINISGSGRVRNFGLFSNEAEVNVAGSGRCDIHVEDLLNVNISGSGRVYYTGNPAINSNITGSGSIINAN